MPSGQVHAAASIFLAVPACGVVLGATNSWPHALAAGAGCLLGIALTPDLDQEILSSSEHQLIKWTLGLGFLWAMFWYPYARLIKHRSPFSHAPIIGTAGRLLYLSIPYFIAKNVGWQPPVWQPLLLWFGIGGLLLSDIAHWAMDTKWGNSSRRRRR